jgi:hypothetical protein
MAEAPRDPASSPAITPRSIFATLLLTLVAAVVATFAGILDGGDNSALGSEALPVPALLAFLPLALVGGVTFGLGRTRLFTRAELVCVLFASMIATPLVTLGFWRYQLAGLSTVVRLADWTKLEALPAGLWPHGEDLFAEVLERREAGSVKTTGGGRAEVRDGVLRIANAAAGDRASLRIRVELGPEMRVPGADGRATAVPGRPYLLTGLVHASGLGADSAYFVRVYADESPAFAFEAISGRSAARRTPLRPDGYVRFGAYPMPLPAEAKRSVTFELGLDGAGTAIFREPSLVDVRAIESAFSGFTRVTEREAGTMSLAERQNAIVVPDRLLSRAGLRYLFGLDYPIGDWVGPIGRLAAFALLAFATTFGLVLVYRKQWLESERYPVPMARIPLVLIGADESQGGLGSGFLRNRYLWLGALMALPFCAIKVARGYFPTLPDVSLRFGLKTYLEDPNWGQTWDGVEFRLVAIFVALGLFMELNVVASLLVGYFLFRLQYWVGMSRGLQSDQDFPYFPHQMLGAYVVYAVLLIVFTRRYLASVGRSVLSASNADPEIGVRRAGVALFMLSFAGFLAWGRHLGMSFAGVGLLGAHVVFLGWISAKFRAECGLPYGGHNHPLGQSHYEGPLPVFLAVSLLGGIPFFGGTSVMVMTLVTAVILPFGFFNVPGLQVELLEVGRRLKIRTTELGLVALLGVLLAVVVGGWVYLTAAYGFGAARFPVAGDFGDRIGAFKTFNAEISAAQSALDAAGKPLEGATTGENAAPYLAMAVGGALTGAAAVLRQLFPGFWFHPIGILVGPSTMMGQIWGSLVLAGAIRWMVLKIGGAKAVRTKLVPVAVGIFVMALLAYAVSFGVNGYYFFFNKGNVKFREFV